MGLDCSHDAFHGVYSAFNRLRQIIAKAADGSFPPHENKELDDNLWYWGDSFSRKTHPGLFVFMQHSDCDGDIAPDDCIKVANDLESLLPKIEKYGAGTGHIMVQSGYGPVTKKFIAGCRLAAKNNEMLTFG